MILYQKSRKIIYAKDHVKICIGVKVWIVQFGSGGGGGQSCKEHELPPAEEGEWKRVVILTEQNAEAHLYYCVPFMISVKFLSAMLIYASLSITVNPCVTLIPSCIKFIYVVSGL
jgi:hypothetical protein